MALVRCAMLVVYVGSIHIKAKYYANPDTDYAKLTRKMGTNKGAAGSSNLRPKSLGPGSPAA